MSITLPELQPPPNSAFRMPRVHPADLIAQLLHEQSTLSAVEQFSTWHETSNQPALASHYRSLLPATMPIEGQQLAFEVDLDRCSGCKACVVACHTLNGLDEDESFREVGLLLGITESGPLFQHVTTACHHCVDPGCLNACPVNAYEKDPVTGIVRHLDDQCFGCQYCTLACPYEVPKYHSGKGIVRKCDMCSQRLSVGEAPACVQACPHQAIRIRTIDVAAAVDAAVSGQFLPSSPDPSIAIPATRYLGKVLNSSDLRSGDYAPIGLEHAHWPLVVLLVFSQISVGIVTLVCLLRSVGGTNVIPHSSATALLVVATVLAASSAISSTLHLGRPWLAFRAFLGLGHSWLSREIAAFAFFIPLCFVATACSYFESEWLNSTLAAAVVTGVSGVLASVMIYHVTRRPLWNARHSGPAFLTTLTGVSSVMVIATMLLSSGVHNGQCVRVLAGIALLSAAVKLKLRRRLRRLSESQSRHNAKPLRTPSRIQLIGGLLFLVLNSLLLIVPTGVTGVGICGLAMTAGMVVEFAERYLFFRAVVPLRMPGVVKS